MSTEFINDQWRLPNAWNGSESNVNKQSNYSMDFDAASSISLGTPSSGIGVFNKQVFSFSVWVKRERQNVNETIVNLFASSSNRGVELKFQYYAADGNYLCLQIGDVTNDSWYNNRVTNINSIMSLNVWYNITCTWDGTDSNIYINNVLRKNWTKNLTISYITSNQPAIGVAPNNSSKYLGEIDSFSYFDYVLSSSQITTLYGSSSTGIGNPMSLSPKPVAYYPLGDQDAFNGANYLVPNIAAQEADGDIATSYSPYALSLDGTNEKIAYTNGTIDLGLSSTETWWIKYSNTSSNAAAIASAPVTAGFHILYERGTNLLYYRIDTTYAYYQWVIPSTYFSDNLWHHYAIVRDDSLPFSSYIKLYIDGNLFGYPTALYTTSKSTTNTKITEWGGASFYPGIVAHLSNIAVWNISLSSTEITEVFNSGVPSNLNNFSGTKPYSWWQLGSNMSYNSNWTILDEGTGNNNGDAFNISEDSIVDGVGSSANGLSSGMGGDEVIGDAPYSSSNSLSVNMDVLDRVTDTPS